MGCDVIAFDVMRFLVLCDVTWCTAMSCDVLSCDELSSVVKWCGAMGWELMSLWCDVAGSDVTLCGLKWLRGSKILWWSVLHRSTPYCTVLQSTTPELQSTTLYYKVLLQYQKLLLQYYSVLQSTTPVLLRTTQYYSSTTKYYSSTTLYYKVLLQYHKLLLQYYSVLQSTTPVLLRTTQYYSSTTKYYSSTTLYYKVLLQYYSVLHSTTPVLLQYYSSTTKYCSSTTPVLLCTTKYYSSTTPYYTVLLQYYSSTTKYYSSTTLYYKVLLQYYSVLQSTTPVPLCTTKYYSNTTKYYSLYYKVLICKARSNRCHPPTSPNIAPATQNDSHDWSFSHMKRHLQCAEQQASPSNLTKYCACHARWLSWLIFVTYGTSFTMRGATGITLQPHQILRLPRKSALQNLSEILRERLKRQFQCAADSTMIRTWSEHELVISHPPVRRGYFSRFGDAFCIENYNISRSGYLLKFHRILRLPRKVTLRHHQMLLLPRQMMRIIDCRRIWNVIYNARSNRHRPPTSPNTAPATQDDSHDWSSSHMERHLQARSNRHHPPTSPNTAPATQKCTPKSKRNSPRTVEASIPMRGRFDHDPNMIRAWTRHLAPARSPRLLFALRRRILYWKLQRFALRLSIQISPNTAPATKSHTPTSPNAAPATTNDAHHWLSSHMKRHLQCAEQQASPSNLTKYCACHARWLSWLIFVTYGTSFTMRGATGITLQPHQILRLPRKSALQNLSEILRERLKRQFQCAADSTMIRPWSEHELVISHPPVRRGYFSRFGDAFCIENYNISRSGYLSKLHQILRLPRKLTLQDHQILRLPRKVTLRHHKMLRLPRKVRLSLNCYWTELLRSCYWAVTKLLLNCHWTELLLNCHWTVTELWLNWPVTELLNWTVTQLSCYWTELLLNCYWTVTELTCYWTVTELTCYWAVTETELTCYWAVILNCYSTELLLNWAVTQLLLVLNCYWTVTELLLNWPVTELTCYWAVTELLLLLHCYLNCCCTGLFAFLNLRNSEVSQLNFLW